MARTSSKAKKTKQEVMKSKTENIEKVAESESERNSTENENEEDNYEVEKIVHTRIYRGKRQYLIRWKGFDEESDTWENESAVKSCPEALEEFEKKSSTIDENDFENEQGMKENKPNEKQSKMSLDEKNNIKDLKKGGNKTNRKGNNKIKAPSSESDNEPSTAKESDPENDKKQTPKKKDLKRKANTDSGKTKQKVKVSKEEDGDEPLTDGKDYEVEKIIEVHSRRDGTKEFLIRWKGYSSKDDTWEPEAHLECKELIEKFMKRVEKAKDMPAKELRESKKDKKFIPTVRAARKHNLRTMNVRPFYQEGDYE